jgi:hypothetical protein
MHTFRAFVVAISLVITDAVAAEVTRAYDKYFPG